MSYDMIISYLFFAFDVPEQHPHDAQFPVQGPCAFRDLIIERTAKNTTNAIISITIKLPIFQYPFCYYLFAAATEERLSVVASPL